MSSSQAPADGSSAPQPKRDIGGAYHPPEKDLVPGPDGTMMSKSAAKKAFKLAEAAAKKAGKQAVAAERKGNAAEGAPKKEKAKKEKVEEPEWVNKTVAGEKKDLSAPMESGYNPDHVEESWFAWWEKAGFFTPSEPSEADPYDPEKTFVIPAPPPNVTGSLHIGHALTISIQDALIRWHRMRGYRTLFVPGYDHAGIATQAVVEKRLAKLEGKTRYDYGREKFVEKVFEWKDDYQARIANQMRRLGASYDFTREAFTMDEARYTAVTENFCKLYEDGIIYRANRLVNWCCRLNTTLSNLEVDQKELKGRTLMNVPGYDDKEKIEFGVIVSFSYKIAGSDEKITIATTRPETMLGDTAIAVHPKDPRYTHLHGKYAEHPFLPNRKMPIVCDDVAVDMEFGTGAVKITPAHDPNDYEVGKRHNLEFINILNDDGTLNEEAGPFAGQKRFSARRAVIEALKKEGLYVETKDNEMTIPICSRSGDVVEPLIKPQWWVSSRPLADGAVKAVREQGMVIVPSQSEREFQKWMEIIQDWCISRQLWWGHRIPAYFVNVEGVEQDKDDPAALKNWVVGRTEAQAHERAKAIAGDKPYKLEQDEDVLDTWFSSGLWPFSIMGWPEKTKDLEYYYPNSMLETGWDILFFWVARMVMLGVHLTGSIPFKEVFCHAMVRDAHGRKMSKSLGNVVDPLDVISGITLDNLHAKLLEGNLGQAEVQRAAASQKKDYPKGIPQCGSDALRFALCAYTSAGRDINLDIMRVEGYRKFCNKLWNATRFALAKLEGGFQPPAERTPSGKESLVEKWILHKLDAAATTINNGMSQRNFMAATAAAYNFWLYELCDVYIEAIKPITDPTTSDPAARASAQATLFTCLDEGLKMLHPYMPYVTEELWQRLPRRPSEKSETICLASYPEEMAERKDAQAEEDFEQIFAAVRGVRSLAADYGIQSNIQAFIEVTSSDSRIAQLFESQKDVIVTLVKGCKSVNVVPASSKDIPAGCVVTTLSASANAHIVARGVIDVGKELAKLDKKLQLNDQACKKERGVQERKEEFEKMPKEVQERSIGRLKELEAEGEALRAARGNFERIRGDE
ncbi:putative VAS1-valyl-tRNA synthetase [Jaminaea rosea]|uniref:Valine--tRNA ligase, mitochondrial n=1 Tax=Jaminaea rosea TaxID=1569628 RepID=A0A316UVV8_9BASI|nr:putative VAS1-valyl-tRNA synthetase [Jaminaea rosea]PWN29426.1 putative VAS1-valyl-tRNA synthetase [Jaminaea rosea]